MYPCSWASNNEKCNNFTDDLVCEACLIQMHQSFSTYRNSVAIAIKKMKEPASTYDLIGLNGIILYMKDVVINRNIFNLRLFRATIHDVDTRYYLSDIITEFTLYRGKIDRLIVMLSKEFVLGDYHKKVLKSFTDLIADFTDLVKYDPFNKYDEIATNYLKIEAEKVQLTKYISNTLQLSGDKLNTIIGYYAEIGCIMKDTLDALTRASDGYSAPYVFKTRIDPIVADINCLGFMANSLYCDYAGASKVNEDMIQWMLQHKNDTVKYVIGIHNGGVYLIAKFDKDIFPYVYAIGYVEGSPIALPVKRDTVNGLSSSRMYKFVN